MKKPQPNEYPPYSEKYISLVKTENIFKELKDQIWQVQTVISNIPEEKEEYAYASGKWTIKEVFGHMIDAERVFGYRALCFSRKDKTPLPGFDENLYVENSNFKEQSLHDLAREFAVLRESNISMIKHFNEEKLNQLGNANGNDVSVRSIVFMIVGHVSHHLNVIQKKYLLD